ncbi:MAG: HD-GYP domain-containing protein [Magnetococcales bacterium]|nr:HD-GYP domain-containing protein [Magnetococcales bacterium]MBF0148438.1 HD-GYP domain-containing protein [Magnetococcales bacterium]
MNLFRKRAAVRIAIVSLVLASIASPISWFVARENAEESIIAQAIEEVGRLLHHHDAIELTGPGAEDHATKAAHTIAGGLFDIAEIYNNSGEMLAESMTPEGERIEGMLPTHQKPDYHQASYESISTPNGSWAMRVFVPLRNHFNVPSEPITGYFEGVRIVPEWQKTQILNNSLLTSIIVGLASLLCGLTIYPVVIHLSAENERKSREVLDSHVSMMEALGRAISKRDSDTGIHNYRVAWMSALIGEKLGLKGSAMQSLIAGSFLHDVGKIGIPDAILLKPGRLDEEELRVMRTHVEQGMGIVSGMGWLDGAADVVAGHHEKWDGTGYPNKLSGENIPIAARIFAVADVFDALCSKRPYKAPMDLEKVMKILEEDTGTHFDPQVMAVFKPMSEEIHGLLEQATEENARQLLEKEVRLHFDL